MIEFSEHARVVNIKRKISKNKIILTVKKPDEVIKSYRAREIKRRKFADKILEVVTIREEDKIIIITQYYLERKYAN